jgi:hypothetical protein
MLTLHSVLSLQRAAGNLAVADLVTGKARAAGIPVVLQRDDGAAFNPDQPGDPTGRGAQRFPAASRGDWMSLFQVALQGVAGKGNLTPQTRTQLAASIADQCMVRMDEHGCEIRTSMDSVTDPQSKDKLSAALALNGPWGDSFKSALQTTAGGDYRDPAEPVTQAYEIANQAVLASGALDENLWNIYIRLVRDQACVSSES